MRKVVLILAIAAAFHACSEPSSLVNNPVDYVNPFIGASTSTEAAGVYHGPVVGITRKFPRSPNHPTPLI